MPRSARKESGCGIYHVMMRGINRQAIFDDDEDCRRFMDILADLPFQHDDDGRLLSIRTCVVYAWCLMTNHFHLLVMEKDWKIAEVIKSLASSYVYYYKKKNERIGHLFQERFKSEPCNDMEFFTTLLRYIHQNPVKAGIVEDAADDGGADADSAGREGVGCLNPSGDEPHGVVVQAGEGGRQRECG